MTRELSHRGPDSENYWNSDDNIYFLGHRRLSIIELSSKGNQPMKSRSNRFIITFNGEIYNHLEIRDKIKKKINYEWRSNSDTETLLSSFEIFGLEKTFELLEGMFAFALIDQFSKKLYLSRDISGEKPLYYGFQGEDFIFSSELKSIIKYPLFKKIIDQNSLKYFLDYSFIPEPFSIFKNIKKLEKSSLLEFDLKTNKIIKNSKYNSSKNIEISKNEVSNNPLQLIDKILTRSVRISMTSDVEVGSFLSGGTDSSLITSIMSKVSDKKVQTFSVSIKKNNYDEGNYSKSISDFLQTNHNQIIIEENDLIKQTKDLAVMYDEPFADSSQIPTSLISKFASSKVKVILSGDGADEYFGGYNRYLGIKKIIKFFDILPFKVRWLIGKTLIRIPDYILNIIFLILTKITNSDLELNQINEKIYKFCLIIINCKKIDEVFLFILKNYFDGKNILIENEFNDNLEKNLIKSVQNENDATTKMMRIDQNFYLQNDILQKVDRASMYYSLETRMPFLNKNVMEFSNYLPLNYKIKGNETKWILKELLKKYIPEQYVNRPKMGFSVPINSWLRTSLKDWTKDTLSSKNIKSYEILDPKRVENILQQHFSEKKNYGTQLWNLIVLQKWLNKFY